MKISIPFQRNNHSPRCTDFQSAISQPRRSSAGAQPAISPIFDRRIGAFTLVEILIAIGIFGLVLTGIYSSWTAILRSAQVANDAAAAVQRSRIAVRTLEDSLTCIQSFAANQRYYGFISQKGEDGIFSFVARLPKSFPRSGKFGDLDVRRVTFSLESGPESSRQLVLRQNPLLMEWDIDEKEHPLVLAKYVNYFQVEFYDQQKRDWVDEWIENRTNQLPRMLRITLRMADNARATQRQQQEIVRIVSLPSLTVQPAWQVPMLPNQPGLPGVPGAPGTTPGVIIPGQPTAPSR
jgi:type II secretion system protein J